MKDKDGRMVPTELVFALEEDRDAMGAWETMPRSHQRDFTRWVDEAEPEERAEKAGEARDMIKGRMESAGRIEKREG